MFFTLLFRNINLLLPVKYFIKIKLVWVYMLAYYHTNISVVCRCNIFRDANDYGKFGVCYNLHMMSFFIKNIFAYES